MGPREKHSMQKYIIIGTLAVAQCCLATTLRAQDEMDIFRFSQSTVQGTARSTGFGGALGSIGGDFSTLSVNPAGIGIYRSSEFMFSPSLKFLSQESQYGGQATTANNIRFNFNNLGVIFTSQPKGKNRSKPWRSTSFGIGMNRTGDFNRDSRYKGYNNTSSYSEIFLVDAMNYPEDLENLSTLAGQGYQAYLINVDSTGFFYSPVDYTQGLIQEKTIKERGGISELVFSLGGNYRDRLMLGATLGIPSLRYSRDTRFRESDANEDPHNGFRFLEHRKNLDISGSGFNLKLGMIYRVNDQVRLGAALHTPTYFSLSEIETTSLASNLDGPAYTLQAGDDIPDNLFDYGVTTPWKAVLSASVLMGRHGFISADYEYVGYGTARFHYSSEFDDYETMINDQIRQRLGSSSNFRIGAEGRWEQFMGRLGFGYYGSPFKADDIESHRLQFSGGLGWRFANWFLDLGLVHYRWNQWEQPYSLYYPSEGWIDVPTAKLDQNALNFVLTTGWKF